MYISIFTATSAYKISLHTFVYKNLKDNFAGLGPVC